MNTCDDVESLYLGIDKVFKEIQASQPWLEVFSLNIDKTINYLEFYYYCVETHSENCIVISISNEYSFIYRESDSWNLSDNLINNRLIAEHLMSWKCLTLPSKVIDIKNLILEGYWKFDTKIVPKLNSETPIDVKELISWDEKCVLTATNRENMCVISRNQWSEIINNENKFID